ncbi:hypothetical protein HVS_10545 [Acetivibrio saccincola]|uniref:Phosphatidylglycerol lysyltransferase n=1 Tax=Acetivibrio saccincola TaxID=1677857 RepID=A0A2K9ECY6_9FIRM|nr:hypothetical protein HVS_10545 [Acetivibrio saccincola]
MPVLWSADYKLMFDNITKISLRALSVICFLQLFTILLINLQWIHLAKASGLKIKFKDIFHVNMYGTIAESITPSVKAGGEFLKAYILKDKFNVPYSKGSALIVLQKTISMIVFLFMNILATILFLYYVSHKENHFKILILSLLFLFLLIFLLVFSIINPKIMVGIASKIPFIRKKHINKLDGGLTTFKNTIKKAFKQKRVLFYQLVLSLIIWNLFPLKAYLVCVYLSIDISYIPILAITYLTYMIGMVPLLPGGLGSFEASAVLFLSSMGVAAYESLAFALIFRFVTFWFVFLASGIYVLLYKISGALSR